MAASHTKPELLLAFNAESVNDTVPPTQRTVIIRMLWKLLSMQCVTGPHSGKLLFVPLVIASAV